jgi:hypothetical protein
MGKLLIAFALTALAAQPAAATDLGDVMSVIHGNPEEGRRWLAHHRLGVVRPLGAESTRRQLVIIHTIAALPPAPTKQMRAMSGFPVTR